LGARVVTGFGADHQLTVPFSAGFHANLAEASGLLGMGGLVSDGVLIADVVRDVAADLVDFVERLGKKSYAAGTLGNDLERTLGKFRMLFVAQDPDGVNHRPILFL